MRTTNLMSAILFVTISSTSGLWAGSSSDRKATTVEPDNTERNKEILESGRPTAMEQSNDKSDIDLAAKIRKAVIKDKSLSSDAHNIKIVTNKGEVHVAGPVASEAEKRKIEQIVGKYVEPRKVKWDVEVTK